MSTQFYIREEDIGKRRDKVSQKRLSELNPYVHVDVIDFKLELLDGYQVVVCTSMPMSEMERINEETHKRGIKFVCADVKGVCGMGFVDFCLFETMDPTGEPLIRGMIAGITRDEEGVVTCLEDSKHGLQDGDYVRIREVRGMEINDTVFKVKVLGPLTFSIGNTCSYSNYISHGVFEEVKMPLKIQFEPLKTAKLNPKFLQADYKLNSMQLHLGFLAGNKSQIHDLALLLNTKVDEKLLNLFFKHSMGEIAPMCTIIGGLMAQEVIKGCSLKLTPLNQFFYMDAFECLDENADLCPLNQRYDGQIQVLGREMQQKLQDFKAFVVGAGAIGCEMLKNFALMGIGKTHVTDMDVIEKSNLNRQFLFRSNHVGKLKSQVAVDSANQMNPNLQFIHYDQKVCLETEHLFTDVFYSDLDVVMTALDNVEARRYLDNKCILFKKPMFDSGTLGVKGSTQVVVPYLTESYTSSHDAPEKQIPMCTLKNFPNQIEHTIQWARDLFEGLFTVPFKVINQYLRGEKIQEAESAIQVQEFLIKHTPKTIEDCVFWARLKFDDLFVNNIKQLLHNFPLNAMHQGQLFWSGPKRPPTIHEFSSKNEIHLDFVYYAAVLHARNYNIHHDLKKQDLFQMLQFEVKKFVPKDGVKIQVSENDKLELEFIELPSSKNYNVVLFPEEFEKDNDLNSHVDFIDCASNIRAQSYQIPLSDKNKTKQIAGKIIPAIATTTALVTGLICLEIYKLILKRPMEQFKNTFVNLSYPQFSMFEPIAAPKKKYNNTEFTLWDRIELNDCTLEQLLMLFEKEYQLKISMMSCGKSLLFSFFLDEQKRKQRLPMLLSEIIPLVSKTDTKDQKLFVLELCCENKNEEDVDTPFILLKK